MNNLYNDRLLAILITSLGYDVVKYLEDDDVVEIMLNDNTELWADTHSRGRFYTGININPTNANSIIETVASSANTVVTKESPILSAELPGSGSRFQGMIPPVVQNPTFTVRKKALQVFSLENYVERGILSENQYEVLVNSIANKKNILVAGGTGSGKTTFCNACLAEISQHQDRVVIIEDTQELQCTAPDRVFLRTSDTVSMQELLKSTMRLRPDRIVVGELRDGGSSLSLLSAWNSGHPGGLCTIHADNAQSALTKLGQYINQVSVNKQDDVIAEVIDLVVVIKRLRKGNDYVRTIDSIMEVIGLNGDGSYILRDVSEKKVSEIKTNKLIESFEKTKPSKTA